MPGASPVQYRSSRGRLSYTPLVSADTSQPPRFPDPLCRPRQRRPHSIQITRLPVSHDAVDRKPLPAEPPRKPSRLRIEVRKLASRDNAKRVLGSIFPSLSSSASSSSTAESSHSSSPVSSRPPSFTAGAADCTSLYWRRSGLNTSGLDGPAMPELAASGPAPGLPGSPTGASKNESSHVAEKPVCAGSGVSCYIILAEPTIFLTGLDHDGAAREPHPSRSSAMLRGVLRLDVSKSAKIKAVTLKFTGRARTEWPEGKSVQSTLWLYTRLITS
jgi:hypothetical protein